MGTHCRICATLRLSPRRPARRISNAPDGVDGAVRVAAGRRIVVAIDDLLSRYGRNPFSFFVRYDAPWQWFRSGGGAAPYLQSGCVAIVWGDPLVAETESAAFLDELTSELRSRSLRICILLVGTDVAEQALARGYGVLKIGEQPFFAFDEWQPPRGNAGKHLRWCLNQASRAGVHVRPFEPGDEPAVADAVAAWQAGLGRPAAESFLRVSVLTLRDEKRLFVACRDGRIDAVVSCSPAPAANGWLLEDLVRRPDAAKGATEALVTRTLESLAAGGAACAWMDVAPLRGSQSQLDMRARLIFSVARPAVAAFDARYGFRRLTAYLGKFHPTSWTPRYVALNPPLPTPALVRALRALL